MSKYVIIFLMVATLGVNVWIWGFMLEKSFFSPAIINPSPTLISSNNNSPKETCETFQGKFGITTDELISYINAQSETPEVIGGYLNFYGKLTGLTPNSYFPIIFRLDSAGKVTKIECAASNEKRNETTDVDFTLPETDFAQIVRYRETLDESQAPQLLQNLTTNPVEVKQKILLRLQNLQ